MSRLEGMWGHARSSLLLRLSFIVVVVVVVVRFASVGFSRCSCVRTFVCPSGMLVFPPSDSGGFMCWYPQLCL